MNTQILQQQQQTLVTHNYNERNGFIFRRKTVASEIMTLNRNGE